MNKKKGNHIPEAELKKQLVKMFMNNGVFLPADLLEFSHMTSRAFLGMIQNEGFCGECLEKLYREVKKEYENTQ